jgi:hydroxymethylglutaryl-CoA synthase
MMTTRAGISSIGLHLPSRGMRVEELASLRHVDPAKLTVGLGCRQMALCAPGEGVASLAIEAARRALSRWHGDVSQIGLLAVGTETALDMSRPLSAWVADGLGLCGALRSYEVKHACYGGTLALRQALEWKLSGAAPGKAALVVAADVALYAEGDPGEPTQGAGAVAMIVDDDARLAVIDPVSFTHSEPAFDFWRPVGQPFPSVDGPLSLDCYKRATERCFAQLLGGAPLERVLESHAALAFHVPFPKMVRKAFVHLGECHGLSAERIEALWRSKVEPTLAWNLASGNAYTAALWIAVARALAGRTPGETITAFSYGSGFGAELLVLRAREGAAAAAWAGDVERDLAARTMLDASAYEALRRAPTHA